MRDNLSKITEHATEDINKIQAHVKNLAIHNEIVSFAMIEYKEETIIYKIELSQEHTMGYSIEQICKFGNESTSAISLYLTNNR